MIIITVKMGLVTRKPARISALAAVVVAAVVVASALGACAPNSAKADTLTVAVAFYPLQYVVEQVGGDDVTAIPLVSPGAEPHDVELSPATIRRLGEADLVIYLSGFQPAIDDAIASTGVESFDIADAVFSSGALDGHGQPLDARATTLRDPHFWLDPDRMFHAADILADVLTEADDRLHGHGTPAYRERADVLMSELEALDRRYADGLASCERHTILVSHEAFGYLANRYGLTQVGLSGLDPEAEPSPARIREVRDIAQRTGATTVFVETLVDPSVVEAFASDAGLAVATLDPIENAEPPDDYLTIMDRNLAALEDGLGCS